MSAKVSGGGDPGTFVRIGTNVFLDLRHIVAARIPQSSSKDPHPAVGVYLSAPIVATPDGTGRPTSYLRLEGTEADQVRHWFGVE